MTASDEYAARIAEWKAAPCCAVPLMLPNEDCWKHEYRGLVVDLADAGLRPEVRARALRLETAAMVRALVWHRDTAMLAALEEAGKGTSALDVLVALQHRLNRLIAQLEG